MKWKIGNIEIKNSVVLAPMAGISNPSYMKICEEMGVGYAVTELISSEAIIRDNKKTFDMLKGIENISIPVAIQIFGSNPETMAKAAKIITDLYKNVIIDINMGCPVPKVAIRSEAGSSLLKNPDKIKRIVEAVVNAVNVPVTVKIRSGWDEKSINAVEVAKIIEKAGASAIAVHARTRSQGYSGKANWDIIKQVKESVDIPVIGNGDITSPWLAKDMLEKTGCDAVMIGRALLGNPWLIRDTVMYLDKGVLLEEASPKEKIDMLKKHYKLLLENTNEKQAIMEIRAHAVWYVKGLPGSALVKNKICQSRSSEELFNVLNEYIGELSDKKNGIN